MNSPEKKTFQRALRRTAMIAGIFCLAIWTWLLFQHFFFKANDPMKSQRLAELKEQLRNSPKDEKIKVEIRQLDQQLRQRYFNELSLTNSGGWLLLIGATGFLIAAKKNSAVCKAPFFPQGQVDRQAEVKTVVKLARRSVGVIGVAVALAFAALAFGVGTKLPKSVSDWEKATAANSADRGHVTASDIPSREEFNRNWPQFRGPLGSGFSTETNLPTKLDASSTVWKTAIPARGFNSPIVWGNRVFLSGGDANKREVCCFSAENGQLLWQKTVPSSNTAKSNVEIPDSTGFAAATMATDGRRVFAIFASYDLAAFKFDGQLVWSKNFGAPKNTYGHSASLATRDGLLFVQLDQAEASDHLSKLYAFDGKTGRVIWERPRPVPSSWSSPLVVEPRDKAQIITLALPWVIAYSATDGTELWRCDGLNGEIAPSAAFGAGLVFAISPSEKLMAIRPDGAGEITKTHVTWKIEDNVPDISSPAANDDFVFIATTSGMVSCFNAKDGKKNWEHEFQTEIFASPTVAGGRLFLFAKKGTAIVADAAPQFREIARADLNEEIFASPAFVKNRIFVRGQKNLFCFATAPTQFAKP